MSADQEQIFSFSVPGIDEPVTVPVAKRKSFLDANPGAVERRRYRVPGIEESVWIPDGKPVPEGAERVYRFRDAGGETYNVPRSKLGAHIDARKAPDKDRSWGSYAGEAYADAPKAVGRTIAAAGAGVVQGVGGTLADLGPGDAARRERQRALDAAPERIPTMKEAGREIGLSQAEIDALPDRPVTLRDLDDPRFGQAYRDRVRATMRRVAENAPETEAEKAHREEAERLQAKADKLSAPLMEPRNAAERAAMHFGGGVATVGELGLAGALGGPAAVPLWMGATGAAREAARQEAEGKTPREAMAGALAPAAAEAAAWTVPIPVGQGATALGRVGREALTMGVKSDLAGTARRTLSGEEAPALSDRIAEDLGAAAMGGALGAAREGAGAAGRRIVRAVERDARERAARLAALDPATALGRAAEAVTPPEVRETARNLEAAAVPESPMDAYSRRRAAEAAPLTDYAGSAGREFLERGARDLERREADAARLAEEELATREAPQVAPEEVPPTVAPEVRGGVQTPPPAPEPAPAASVSPGISEWVGEYLARYEQARKRANDVFDHISGRKWGEGLPITEHDEMQRRLEGVVSGMGNDELAAVEKAADANRDAAKKIDDKNAERIWNQVSYHAAATRLMREAATKPTAREPATFPLGMDPRLGRKSIPGFVVPLEGELVPGAEIAFQGNAPGKPSVGKIVEDMGKALAVQPESGPQQIVAREEVYGIRAAVPPAEPAPAAPVAGSATPPRAESATPYTVDGAGNVGRRDGKPLTPQDVKAVKKIAKAAGVNLYKDRVNGNLRAPGFGLGGSGNPALSAALDGRPAEAPSAPAGPQAAPAPAAPPVAGAEAATPLPPASSPRSEILMPRAQAAKEKLPGLLARRAELEKDIETEKARGITKRDGTHVPTSREQGLRQALASVNNEIAFASADVSLVEADARNAANTADATSGKLSPKVDDGRASVFVSRETTPDGTKVPVLSGERMPEGATLADRMAVQRKFVKNAVAEAQKTATSADAKEPAWEGAEKATVWGKTAPRVRIEVPGDGTFTVPHEKHFLQEWGKKMDAALAPSALKAPSVPSGRTSARGAISIAKTAPKTFTSAAAHELLEPFATQRKDSDRQIRQGKNGYIYYTDGYGMAVVEAVEGAKDFKRSTGTNGKLYDQHGSDIELIYKGIPKPEGDSWTGDTAELLRDVREVAPLSGREDAVWLVADSDGRIGVVADGNEGAASTEHGARARVIGHYSVPHLENALTLMAKTGNAKFRLGYLRPSGDTYLAVTGEKGNAGVLFLQNRSDRAIPEQAEVGETPAAPAPASAPRGGVRADVAAEAPRAAGAPAPESPHEGLRTKLKVLVDSGATPEEMEAFAREAEASDAFATAALARQRAGTYRGTPWGTEGGDVWPAEPPPMAKLELGDMVDLARGLSSSGAVPKVVRRISRVLRGKAAGVFRASEGDAKSGKVELIGRLFGLVDADERASVERRATEKAEKTGADPDSPMYREAYRKAYEKGMADAIEGSMRSGPKRAMAVLAHEIGHWIDFLSEGDLKRGNVLGHIAALKRNAVQTLWRDPATAGLAGTTGWTERMREEVHRDVEKRVKRKDFASDEEYRDAYRAEMDAELLSRGLESHGVVREQMERLVAWFRQSDGAPEYFAKDPAELYAEAFSAWMNYPANARRLAPRFVQLMDDWIAAHGEAGRAVKRFQAMAAERSAAREAAAAAGGPTSDAEFFERRRKEGAAASMAEDPALRPVLSNDADPPSITRWTRRKAEFLNQAVGPRTMLEDMILGAPDAKNNPDAIPVFRALLDLDNSGNMARLWRYRFDSRVMPKLESAGIPLDDFRDYLKYSRLGNEITGPLQDRGAANKAGPGGVAPGYGATGARARVADLRAKYGPAIEDARRAFVQDVRRGADAGGEGSILGRLLDSPVLSEEQKRVLGNEWYVSLRRAMVPDTTREVSSGREMSNWNGIWSLRTGSLQETGDVIANTLLQDWTMFQQVMRQEARLRLVDYLKAHKPEWVGGEAEMKVVAGRDSDGNPFVQRVPKQQKKEGWRVVTFMRDGKAEGWWVPDFVAQALEPQTFAAERTRGAREAEAAVAALSRASNAALTTANLVFNPINALSRDPNGLSRYALPRVGEGAKGAIYNTVGDASIAVRSLANDAATRMERGQYDPRVVHALASGALNDTASGWGPNGGTRGVAGMAEDIRRTGRAELTEDEVRRFWEGFGNRPERVNAALAREGSTWKKAAGAVAKAWGMGPGRLNEWLGRREMSSKAASLADLEARRPDLSPEERAWWVKNMMGTPDLSNRPLLDRNPYVRVLAPFFTPFAHGIRYQLLRAFQKMPGTLGRRLAAQMLPKAVAVAAPAALVAMAREAAQEADEMKKGGRFSEDAVQAKLDEAARLVAVGQAWAEIPLRHRMNGFTFPLPGGRYLYAPTDQGLLAVESAVLGGIVAPMAKQGGGWEGFAGAVNEAMPNFGPLPNTLVGLATGYDLNMGREVAGEREQHPAARTAGWAWDNLTGRGLGILPSATVERWITGDGPDAGEAAKRAYSWPFLSSIPGAFVRKRGSGAWAARAGAVRQGKAEEKEMRGEAAAGAAAAAEGDAERAQQAARRIAELGGDPQARLQSAAERRNLAGSDLSPSERLVVEKKGKLSDASREWLDPMAQAMLFMPEVWQRLHEKPAD